MLNSLELTLCKMQGTLFEMSATEDYESESFIKTFMLSNAVADLDKEFNHMQWAGEAYILSRLKEEDNEKLKIGGDIYDKEVLFWIGYLYRYWHYYTGESSKDIFKQASASTMRSVYLMYHTMSCELAIERLKESYRARHKK